MHVGLGPLEPPVIAFPQSLLVPKFPAALAPLQPLLRQPQPQPQSAAAEPEVQVALPVAEATPTQVPTLLALVLAQPLRLAWSPVPVPGQAPGVAAQVSPVPVALPVAQQVALLRKVALPKVLLLHDARAPLLRLRPPRVSRGARQVEGEIQKQVAQQEQDPLSPE